MVVEDDTQNDNSESQDVQETNQDVVEQDKKFTKTSLKAMKIEELVKLCEEKNISVLENDKKVDLIEKLLATVE